MERLCRVQYLPLATLRPIAMPGPHNDNEQEPKQDVAYVAKYVVKIRKDAQSPSTLIVVITQIFLTSPFYILKHYIIILIIVSFLFVFSTHA